MTARPLSLRPSFRRRVSRLDADDEQKYADNSDTDRRDDAGLHEAVKGCFLNADVHFAFFEVFWIVFGHLFVSIGVSRTLCAWR